MSYKIQMITKSLVLGEGPHWDAASQSLFFVSIHEQLLNKYEFATGEHTQTKLEEGRAGFLVPVEGKPNQFLIGMEHKFLIIEWDGQNGTKPIVLQELGEPNKQLSVGYSWEVDQHEPTNRINDGKADPRGRIFAGTMGLEDPPGEFRLEKGSLFRLDPSKGNKIDRVADKIGISNGLAWDLKEKAFYYCDSLEAKVRRYDYDVETGQISNMRYIFDMRKNDMVGNPDGCTIDTDGNLWIAVFDESAVVQVDPRTSKLLRKISLPVKQVTSVTFGGPDLDILFVTTANMFIGEEQPPPSGCTLMITGLGVKGHPNVNFKP